MNHSGAAWDEAIQTRTLRILVIGIGYVGLPAAVRFAEAGYRTVCADIIHEKVNQLNNGQSPLPDAVPDARVQGLVRQQLLRATTNTTLETRNADVVIVAVPTPNGTDHVPDLGPVESAGTAIGEGLQKGTLVILESTVFPGATERHLLPGLIGGGLCKDSFLLAHCPERVSPGEIGREVGLVDRVVGGLTPDAGEIGRRLYQSVTEATIHQTSSLEAAEAVKVYENTQRDLLIAFANEMGLAAERLGINAWEVAEMAATKWNVSLVYPGAGVGGHCLPIDPWYLHHRSKEAGYETQLIPVARGINDGMPNHMIDLLRKALRQKQLTLEQARVAVLGLSYKAGLSDCRESPAIRLANLLAGLGSHVVCFDPHIPRDAGPALGVQMAGSLSDAARDADALVVMTAEPPFATLPFASLGSIVRHRVIVDGRGIIEARSAAKEGWQVSVLGRGDLP